MAKVELKALIVEEISALFDSASTIVVVDARGLTVAQDTVLRSKLREAGVSYKVYKNTYVNRAISGTANADLAQILEGPSAFAVCKDDATAAARVLAEFAKTAEALEIKGGMVEGTYYDANAMKAIAEIPSRDALLSRLLGSLQSPVTNFARVLKQIAEKDAETAA